MPELLLAAALVLAPVQDSLPLRLTPLWELGTSDDTVYSFSRLMPAGVASGTGNLYVVDIDRHRVMVLNAEGRLTASLGRQGQGPGELMFPGALTVAPSGVVSVYDAAKRAIVRFGKDGKALPEIRLLEGIVHRLHAEDDSTYVITLAGRDSTQVLRMRGDRREPILAIAPPKSVPIMSEKCGVSMGYQPYFSPRVLWTGVGTTVVTNVDGSFILTPSPVGTVLTRKAERQKTSEKVVREFFGDSMSIRIGDRGECQMAIAPIASRPGMIAPVVPAYEWLTTVGNRVWAIRFTPRGQPRSADLFDLTKGYVGSVSLGNAMPVAVLPGNRLVSLERDEDDVYSIHVYGSSGT